MGRRQQSSPSSALLPRNVEPESWDIYLTRSAKPGRERTSAQSGPLVSEAIFSRPAFRACRRISKADSAQRVDSWGSFASAAAFAVLARSAAASNSLSGVLGQ